MTSDNNSSQNYLELVKVYNFDDKVFWQVECNYIFKRKQDAVAFMNKIDYHLPKTKQKEGNTK